MPKKSKTTQRINNSDMILSEKTPWYVQEAYKTLRTNIMFSLPGSDHKVIGITSAMPHDGKTMNAINIAISFAQLGKKVLLIDADMRIPAVAARCEIEPYPGLSDVLVGVSNCNASVSHSDKFNIDIVPVTPRSGWRARSV